MAKISKGKTADKTIEIEQVNVHNIDEPVLPSDIMPKTILFTAAPKSDLIENDGKTLGEKIVNYVKKNGGKVALNDFFRHEFNSLVEHPQVAKEVKEVLKGLVDDKKIDIEGDFNKLGKFYYLSGDPETKYFTLANTPLMAKVI